MSSAIGAEDKPDRELARQQVPITNDYGDYQPPLWVRSTVVGLMSSLPEGYCIGLAAIVLTKNSGDRTGRRLSRANRHKVKMGTYRWTGHRKPASIELFVDQIVGGIPKPLCWVQCARDVVIGRVLFHELGHHLSRVVGPLGRDPEQSAEAWRATLMRMHLQRHYAYLRPLAPAMGFLARMLRGRTRRVGGSAPRFQG